jgi:hypothetical protein
MISFKENAKTRKWEVGLTTGTTSDEIGYALKDEAELVKSNFNIEEMLNE